jgi:alcohol dehydrogenase (cytochrome c)
MLCHGGYRGWRHSALQQVNASNVKKLAPRWTFLPGVEENFQSTPIVVDGVMYVSSPRHSVYALDATNGRMLWRYAYKLPDDMPLALVWNAAGKERGVTVAHGRVFMNTNDGLVIALDARTGTSVWERKVADY